MQNYFGYKYPCTDCPKQDSLGRCYVMTRVASTKQTMGCAAWNKWVRKTWPRLCKILTAQANRARQRTVWRYYHPDEVEAMRRGRK